MNKHYKIAFIGLGSIGERHLRNVRSFLINRGDSCNVDIYRHKLQSVLPDGVDEQILYASDLKGDVMYDIVFITNPTSMHADAISKFIGHTNAFFIEKPIFSSIDVENSLLEQLNSVKAYVACPLRYNPVIQYVCNSGISKEVISVRAISSSYLPDWRPNVDYRQCYSAHRDMGGGVDIDLIHEWDYITWLFGMPSSCHRISCKVSSLEIDSDDLAIYIAKIESVGVEVHLDYFGRTPIRQLELFLPDDTILCDIINGHVKFLKSGKQINFIFDRNEFQLMEIEHFFDIVDNCIDNDSDVRNALQVLKIAKGN